MKLTKLLTSILAGAAISAFAADASTATPKKVGPVSYYGALHTSGSKIIGAKNNQQVMLRGVSLFWSDATGLSYYNPTVISWVVDNLKIDVFRYAMGIEYYDSNGGTKNKLDDQVSYTKSPEGQLSTIDRMVQAAIENDVYIVIDWHSHRAHLETSIAKDFFAKISQKYKDVPNIIYEIYNEPVSGSGGDWGAIKNYANSVVPAIRTNTQNLIIVGTPNWSQHPEQGARDPIQSTNIAYVLHFYASSHSKGSYGSNVSSALSAGYPVFISEWGTTNADGDGEPNSSATNEWTQFMDQNMIPNCNWSLRQQTSDVDQKSEKSAIFAGEKSLITAAALDAATFTSSGNIIKSYLTKNARSWADSLVKGKSGSCSFKATTAKQTDGKISGVLKSGCTYTSSNEKVASASGSDIVVGDYGFAILTGNDGSQSIVTVKQVAGQTITNLSDITCNYSGSCTAASKNGMSRDFDGDGVKDYLLTMDDKTNEGSKFTLTSLDPTTVSVSKSKCTNNNCSNSQKNQQVWMLHFHKYGTAKVVASAPAITGFRAMQDTFEITYKKGSYNMNNKFKDQTIALGGTTTEGFPDAMLGSAVTYTFNGQPTTPYLTKVGNAFVGGNQNAIFVVTAHIAETADYEEFERSVTVIVGDAGTAVNLADWIAYTQPAAIKPTNKIANSLNARMNGSMLQFTTKNTGLVKVDIYDALGASVKQMSEVYGNGSHAIDLKGLPNGSYTLVVRQGSQKASIRWTNK
ncbi:cellulase family glycosylhydrolase [Fibrobacter sp. UWB11]|uniref:cellulase family glycosylhydrolase n=1 Tax=Fibrobacter sp. UWB11 TaxID=1896202 RepID=UPI00092A7684|nr:cellulase family glycosylhydrolase [Fibrobacter sp. UWB11]SIO31481.1 endoglucanase [Fibrobacter sp. UWB11]